MPISHSTVDAALHYAARGWHVFPCREKRPATPRGHHDATTDPATIPRWFTTMPDANIGIACAPSGLVVLDIDPRHGGDDSLVDLERDHGALSTTPRVITGGGGLHVYFTGRAGDRIGVRPGLDVKGTGYVIAPPSMHACGRRYLWELGFEPESVPLVSVPPWLMAVLTERSDRLSFDGSPLVIAEGERNRRLFQLGCALRRYGLPKLNEHLMLINRDCCRPPLDRNEVEVIATNVLRCTRT